MGKSSKDKRDIYYRRAKEEGWRARSAYKLLQLDAAFGLLAGVRAAVDLCAAPGSWSQVLSRRLYLPAAAAGAPEAERPRLVAVDLQPMAPVEGVAALQGDVTAPATLAAVAAALGGRAADLVVCDGAPDVTGLHDMDEYVQAQLVLAALAAAAACLRPGGALVAKVFRGAGAPLLYAQLRCLFADVAVAKPRSSRGSSVEAFAVCRGYAPPPGLGPAEMRALLAAAAAGGPGEAGYPAAAADEARRLVPFLACGDLSGWDADQTYELEPGGGGDDGGEGGEGGEADARAPRRPYEPLPPVQPPTAPPYREALERLRRM